MSASAPSAARAVHDGHRLAAAPSRALPESVGGARRARGMALIARPCDRNRYALATARARASSKTAAASSQP